MLTEINFDGYTAGGATLVVPPDCTVGVKIKLAPPLLVTTRNPFDVALVPTPTPPTLLLPPVSRRRAW